MRMRKVKVIRLAAFVMAIMIAATCIAYADTGAAQFSDIDGSWAKQHILNVTSKGLMDGVAPGKFGPKENIKQYDAIISIARMINPDNNIDLASVEAKYKEKVLDKFGVPAEARKAVALCLEKGIVKDVEVDAFSIKPEATKQDISVYLGRAFGVKTDSSAPPVILAYKDSMFIPSQYKPFVKYLADKGIVNATGDVNGKFNPDEIVNRETFAKMLDLSNDIYLKEILGRSVAGPGEAAVVPAPADTTVPVNDTPSVPDAIDGKVEIEVDVTAYVDETIPEYANLAVFVGTQRVVKKVADNVVCTMDGASSDWWKLKKGDLVRLYELDGKIVKIAAESKIQKVVGKLISVSTGDKTTIKMEDTNGSAREFVITEKTIVIKDAKRALWQELKPGNSLVITTAYNELIEINADGVKSTDKGVIESVVYSRMAPPKLVITALDGSQNTYYANKDLEIAGAGNDIYSLRPGMQVEVNLIDDEINRINIVTAVSEPQDIEVVLSGQIKQVDAAAKLIVMEVFDKTANNYVDKSVFIKDDTRIADVYLNIITLGELKTGQIIEVRGNGSVEGVYAKVIQLR